MSFEEVAQSFLLKNTESNGHNGLFTKSVNLQMDNRNFEEDQKRNHYSSHQDQIQRRIGYQDGKEVDLNRINTMLSSYSAKKSVATGLLDLALISNNFSQIKQLIVARSNNPWQAEDIVLMFAICLSVILQFVSGVIMLMSAKQEFLDEKMINELINRNNLVIVLFLAITILNIFIDVFTSI